MCRVGLLLELFQDIKMNNEKNCFYQILNSTKKKIYFSFKTSQKRNSPKQKINTRFRKNTSEILLCNCCAQGIPCFHQIGVIVSTKRFQCSSWFLPL